jgi:nucleotide sugar dehydrogenase
MEIGIIGMGTVGRAVRRLLGPHAGIVEYDVKGGASYPSEQLAGCEFAVVCVDTPPAADGSCDTSRVEEAVAALPVDRVLIRSTVAPGTTDRLVAATGKHCCFSPEYIGESPYVDGGWGGREEDVPFVVLGGEPATTAWFCDRLVGMLGPSRTFFQCSAVEAEIVKYMENAFLATKVAFVNEFFEVCGALGADWHRVREGWLLDPRVGRSHSAVFPADRGFDGKCLPKDVRAIVAAAAAAGYDARLLAEVLTSNERHRGGGGQSEA